MILPDTSVWIAHFRSGAQQLHEALNRGQVVMHPHIIAELALGSLKDRTRTLVLLDSLPQVRVAQLAELRVMIEARRLYSLGIGLTDAHLIASVLLDPPAVLWTKDKKLRKVAEGLSIHASLP